MKLLVTGANGQLGRALKEAIVAPDAPDAYEGAEVDWIDLPDLDISNKGDTAATRRGAAPRRSGR